MHVSAVAGATPALSVTPARTAERLAVVAGQGERDRGSFGGSAWMALQARHSFSGDSLLPDR
jgi:hypothetical protein